MKKYYLIFIILLATILRFYQLAKTPPSLYWDETSLGFNAYSILKSAHDEHGKFLPLTNFAAFGDYKPPGYIYAATFPIALFGLNEFAVRFPSAFFGVLTVVLTYFLTEKLFKNKNIALLSAFFLAISPWHLQFSRAAFEANMALFFSTLGIYLFLNFAEDSPWYIFPSAISFIAAVYTFTGQRLFVPPILVVLTIVFKKQIIKNLKFVILATVISFIIFLPLLLFVIKTPEGKLRFREVTIFNDLEPSNKSIAYRGKDNFTWWANIIHNRRMFYAQDYLKHYFDAFNPAFLFSTGDVNPRLSIQTVGELYYFDLILIPAGVYFLISKKQKYSLLIISWLLVSPLGPATARETPHALRMVHILPTFQIISAFGLFYLYQRFKLYSKVFIPLWIILISLCFLYYIHMYYNHWPYDYSQEWQYGYKQAVQKSMPYYSHVDHIIVTKNLGRPYIYFLFYTKMDPRQYLKTADIIRDSFLFYDVNSFDKYIFTNSPANDIVKGKNLYIVRPGELPQDSFKIDEVKSLNGNTVFDIGIKLI